MGAILLLFWAPQGIFLDFILILLHSRPLLAPFLAKLGGFFRFFGCWLVGLVRWFHWSVWAAFGEKIGHEKKKKKNKKNNTATQQSTKTIYLLSGLVWSDLVQSTQPTQQTNQPNQPNQDNQPNQHNQPKQPNQPNYPQPN